MVFLVLTAGKDSVQSPQSYFGGFFKQLTGKWIGTAAAGSLYGALTISRCGDSFLTTQGKVLWFNMNEEHKNILLCLRHGSTLWMSVRLEEQSTNRRDVHTRMVFSKSHAIAGMRHLQKVL